MVVFECMFKGGPFDGRFAKVQAKVFKVGSVLNFSGNKYSIHDGPVARAIEQTQKPIPHTMIVVEWVQGQAVTN